MSKCETCVQDKTACQDCYDHPSVQALLKSLPKGSCYLAYWPACPYGCIDCVNDPAYNKFYHPEWYQELYGDITPEEAMVKERPSCITEYENDPECCRYYDDEDK